MSSDNFIKSVADKYADQNPQGGDNQNPDGGKQPTGEEPNGNEPTGQEPKGDQPKPGGEEPKKQPEGQPNPDINQEKLLEYLETNEDAALKFLSKKTGRDIESFDDLTKVEVKEIEKEPELPEDVKAFWDYKQETGRGLNDWLKANKDWKNESEESVVMEHIRQTEGLEGDELRDYFDLNFKPDEDASEREQKLAKIEMKKRYNQALKDFEKQKEQFKMPTDEKANQRQAEGQSKEDAERFKKNMQEALNEVDKVNIDDFSYEVKLDSNTKEKMTSVEGIMDMFKKDGQLDYKALAETLQAGMKAKDLSKAYAEHYKNKVIEDEMAKLSNRKQQGPESSNPPTGGDPYANAMGFLKRH